MALYIHSLPQRRPGAFPTTILDQMIRLTPPKRLGETSSRWYPGSVVGSSDRSKELNCIDAVVVALLGYHAAAAGLDAHADAGPRFPLAAAGAALCGEETAAASRGAAPARPALPQHGGDPTAALGTGGESVALLRRRGIPARKEAVARHFVIIGTAARQQPTENRFVESSFSVSRKQRSQGG